MKFFIITLAIIFSFNVFAQDKVKRFEIGVGYNSFMPFYDIPNEGLFKIYNINAIYGSLGITFLKHFNFSATYSFGSLEDRVSAEGYNLIFDAEGKRMQYYRDPTPEETDPTTPPTYYYANFSQITFQKYQLSYAFSPHSRFFNIMIGVGLGTSSLFTFNQEAPIVQALDKRFLEDYEEEAYQPTGVDAAILNEIETPIEKTFFISPTLNLDIKITNAIALSLGLDSRYYFQQQYFYSITNLIYEYNAFDTSEDDVLVQLRYVRHPFSRVNYTAGLKFKFGQK